MLPLIASYHANCTQLENGICQTELIAPITHLGFYSGWPTASTALTIAKQVFKEAGVQS